ncbi:hypothetical protein BV898_05226 [Hypsibius exemplaris]|uniref:Uncharacterized protein n=1 Tax=Hypsibius exemplaris TaxID=2072580 RepID=A0A1W0X0C9_HYPEX|nr:hypothetical protein BV898_05226 [Hypsibius exemplaris]
MRDLNNDHDAHEKFEEKRIGLINYPNPKVETVDMNEGHGGNMDKNKICIDPVIKPQRTRNKPDRFGYANDVLFLNLVTNTQSSWEMVGNVISDTAQSPVEMEIDMRPPSAIKPPSPYYMEDSPPISWSPYCHSPRADSIDEGITERASPSSSLVVSVEPSSSITITIEQQTSIAATAHTHLPATAVSREERRERLWQQLVRETEGEQERDVQHDGSRISPSNDPHVHCICAYAVAEAVDPRPVTLFGPRKRICHVTCEGNPLIPMLDSLYHAVCLECKPLVSVPIAVAAIHSLLPAPSDEEQTVRPDMPTPLQSLLPYTSLHMGYHGWRSPCLCASMIDTSCQIPQSYNITHRLGTVGTCDAVFVCSNGGVSRCTQVQQRTGLYQEGRDRYQPWATFYCFEHFRRALEHELCVCGVFPEQRLQTDFTICLRGHLYHTRCARTCPHEPCRGATVGGPLRPDAIPSFDQHKFSFGARKTGDGPGFMFARRISNCTTINPTQPETTPDMRRAHLTESSHPAESITFAPAAGDFTSAAAGVVQTQLGL